ncbi:MAG: DUF881 domain-containing protein [Desulfitobacterium hafniense]|nr:DUF881 domain-containing protein [Desulfitobacterium hafniense]
MVLSRSGKNLLGFSGVLTGFLFILLLKAYGVAGSQVVQPENALPALVQAELENQQLSNDISKLRQDLAKYLAGQSTSSVALQQLQQARANAGLTEIKGPGIRITLDDAPQISLSSDPNNYVIHEEYIRQLINILWNGGAEAISVNDQRITSITEVFCSGSFIQINGTRQMPPFVIKAVGEPQKLQSALKFYLFWERLGDVEQEYGIKRKLEVPAEPVVVPAGRLKEYRYAEPVKES